MVESGNEERVRAIAEQVYLNRDALHRPGDADSDWQEAKKIVQSPFRRLLLRRNRQLIAKLSPSAYQVLKALVWDAPKWAITGLLVALPKAEWVKLLAVPLAVAVAGTIITRNFQREAEQNRILKEYFALLETFTFERELLTQPLDSGVVILARGRTVAALRELDWSRREQLIAFLRASNLTTIKTDENSDETVPNPEETDPPPEENDAKAGAAVQNNRALGENTDDIQEPVISFKNQDLSEMDLHDVNLSNLDFQSTNFQRANLQDAVLWAANLQDAVLWAANLQDAVLSEANLQYADLKGTNLQDAFLWAANLQDAFLWEANLQDADLEGASLQDAFLRAANLQDAFLWATNLQDADLKGASLQDAFLGEADLQGADLSDANLQNLALVSFWSDGLERERTSPAELQAQLAEVKLCGTILPDFIELDGNRDCNSP
ncbi:MAG: pentapeptide repeat-containing protein [Cyanobacteria bacterium P01_C01_bin.120]